MHTYHEWFMIEIQIGAAGMSQESSNHFPDLQDTPRSHMPTPRLRGVWPKSPHSRTSPFYRHWVDCYYTGRSFPSDLNVVYACPNIFLLSIKALFFADRNAGGETILVQPTTFGGCAHFTPHIGYVTDP